MARAGQEQGITIGFNANTTDFDKNVDKLNKEIKGLKKEVKLFNQELKINPNSFSLLYTKIRNLTQQQEKAKKVLQEYKGYLDGLEKNGLKGTDEWNATQDAIRKTNKELRNITVQLDKAKQSMADLERYATGGFEEAIRKAGESMVTIGESMQKISKYSQDFLKEATKQAIEFENAFADVKKTVEETPTTSYEEIERGLRELAQTVPITADELARIGGLAGQMGVGADDIVNFTKAMVDFGNATNITAEEAAQEIAQIYNVIGKGGDYSNLENLLSTIVDLGNNSATTERDIVEMFKNISAASSRVGMTEQQMAALAATLSSLGLDKGGASAISNIMTQIDMDVASEDFNRILKWAKAAGLSVAEFKKAWGEDAAGALATFVEHLKETVDAGGNLNEEFNALGIKELRRVDTLGRLVNAQDVYREALEMSDRAFSEGNALSIEAEKRYQTLASKLQILKNKFDEFKRGVGEQLTPILSAIVDFAGKILDFINALPGGIDQIVVVLTTLLAVLSPLLTVFGKYLLTLTGTNGAVGKLVSNFKGFKGILAGVFGALLTLYVTNEDFRNAVNKTAQSIWSVLKPALENLWGLFQNIWNIITYVVEKMGELWNMFMNSTPGKIFIATLNGIVETIKVVIQIVGGLISVVKDLFGWFGRVLGIQDEVKRNMPRQNYINQLSSGGYSSGGFMSGGMTVNNSFVINGVEQLSNTRLLEVADIITDRVNENLGVAV